MLSLPYTIGNTAVHQPCYLARRAVAALDRLPRVTNDRKRTWVYGLAVDRHNRVTIDRIDAVPLADLWIAVTHSTPEETIAEEFRP